jgi:uncharacterized protein YoxC
MNAQDRKAVSGIVSELEALRSEMEALRSQVEDIGTRLRELADAEQDKFDNLNEGLQSSDNGQAIEEAASNLSDAADAAESGDIEEALDALGNLEE